MPMRFQSLDLNMGDNYVDKHRNRQKTIGNTIILTYQNQQLVELINKRQRSPTTTDTCPKNPVG